MDCTAAVWGLWSPIIRLLHSVSSSSTVNGSACLLVEPTPLDWRRFISPSREQRKSAKMASLKKSSCGFPFCLKSAWCQRPGDATCLVGTHHRSSEPQEWSESSSAVSSEHSFLWEGEYALHLSHICVGPRIPQLNTVGSILPVFFGTDSLRANSICSSVLGAPKRDSCGRTSSNCGGCGCGYIISYCCALHAGREGSSKLQNSSALKAYIRLNVIE